MPVGTGAGLPAARDSLDICVEEYTNAQREAALRVPTNVNTQQLTKWDVKTRWAKFHEGRNMDEIALLSGYTRPLDPPEISMALATMERLLQRWYGGFQDLPEHIRRIFASVDPTVLNPKPFSAIEQESLRKYIRVWQSLIGFLLRSVDIKDEWGLVLEEEHKKLLGIIKTSISKGIEDARKEGLRQLYVLLVN